MKTKVVRTSEHLEAHSRHKYHQYIKQISMKQAFILDYYIWKNHHHHQTKEKPQTKQQEKDKTKQKRQNQNQEQNNKTQQQ